MLMLKEVSKVYNTGDEDVLALNQVNLMFDKAQFVSILGPSGCGKTTLLNILGGLTRFNKGEVFINGLSTSHFKEDAWDSYRNHQVGFVFQSYNLIEHISVLANVELALSLSGIGSKERRKKAREALIKVGLKSKLNKKPKQLSNGQVQRVAIARALVNDPKIILADEPTGALDTETSIQILELLKSLSKDRLVIMVTHNSELANIYSDRIIRLLDGRITEDILLKDSNKPLVLKDVHSKTYMNYITALKLSFFNLIKKVGKTVMSAVAGGIGIVGIGLVIGISMGFSKYVQIVQLTSNTNTPVIIENKTVIEAFPDPDNPAIPRPQLFPHNQLYITSQQTSPPRIFEEVTNVITPEYLAYLENMDQNLYHDIKFYYDITYPTFLRKTEADEIKIVNYSLSNTADIGEIPYEDHAYMTQIFDVLYGRLPSNTVSMDRVAEAVLVISDRNQLPDNMLNRLGFDGSDYEKQITFSELLGLDIKIAHSGMIYEEHIDTQRYHKKSNASIYEDDLIITLKIVGVMRRKQNAAIPQYQGIRYTSAVNRFILNETNISDIVIKQQQIIDDHLVNDTVLYSVLTGLEITLDEAIVLLRTLGVEQDPSRVLIYHKDGISKEQIRTYLEAYNQNLDRKNYILLNQDNTVDTRLVDSTLSSINVVLVIIAVIALFISISLLSILSYISVLQRTPEIGILRSIGARKKDIFRVFSSESFVIGFVSGLFGLLLLYVMLPTFNTVFEGALRVQQLIVIDYLMAFYLLLGNILLSLMIGFIPAYIASNKDPIEALKSI